MIMGTRKVVFREMIHWLWLWMLAAIVIAFWMQSATGQATRESQRLGETENHPSFTIPHIQKRDLERTLYGIIETKNATLHDVLLLNRRAEFESVIKVWQQLDVAQDSVTWRHVGIAAAHLRMDDLDQALQQANRAIDEDPHNAVAEYLIGRVYDAKSRQTPFWYEKDDESPFRLVRFNPNQVSQTERQGLDRGDAFLPGFKTLPFDKQAKQHYRNALRLAPLCNLDRLIEVVRPKIRLIRLGGSNDPVTVRDLLISLGEEDFVEKSHVEAGERLVREG